MKVLNLIREFERLQMKEFESIKEYSNKLVDIANKVRVLWTKLFDSRLVQKVLVSVLENALQAQGQRRLMRQEGSIEGALKATMQHSKGENQKWNGKKNGGSNGSEITAKGNGIGNFNKYSSCKYCGKQNQPHFTCWRRPYVKCRRIKIQKKSFSLNPLEEEQVASKCQEGITSDQMDLLAEQVKVLAREIAFSSSTLKYLLDQFANDPNSSKSQLQNLEREIQEKRNQMRALGKHIIEMAKLQFLMHHLLKCNKQL
ncbi:hypothetical protein J1N35_025073 [Gossypium stocksii]|uniref:Uncharacterized protein n=1 Tax=Gossypium stocksii TaxID=47602 RepID=A0A9D3V5W4_9ROSI|nr:hypothetical protein J1N35_025073 [Gossypium stocksii]